MGIIRGAVIDEHSHKKGGMVMDFALEIKKQLPNHVELVKVILSETSTSFAEWNIEDN
tara:strand:- start:116 stop:289 length:174 start_codon:yes stop_codon:yes gene_type:complete